MARLKANPNETANEIFRREIRVQRAYLDMTQGELAAEIGVVPSVMSTLLATPDKISVGRLRAIIKTLDLDPMIALVLLGYSPKDITGFQQKASSPK